MEQMKTATVRDLRNRYTEFLAWLAAGQEILITQRGKAIAQLVPESQAKNRPVNWSQGPAVRRDRSQMRQLGGAIEGYFAGKLRKMVISPENGDLVCPTVFRRPLRPK